MSEENMLPHSPALQRLATVSTEEILRVLMTTVWDPTVSIPTTSNQKQQTNAAVAEIVTMLASRQGAGTRRPEFGVEAEHFVVVGDVKAWIRTLELIYDAKGLTTEERFLHTLFCWPCRR